jgi:methyl-accepting chemotaxis protein
MLDITCPNCGRSHRVDETRISGQAAKLRCQGCSQLIRVDKPSTADYTFAPPGPTAADLEQPQVLSSPAPDPPAPAESAETPPLETASGADSPAMRFGLTGRTILLMLLVSLLPLLLFGLITRRQTVDQIQTSTEELMAQTAAGLSAEVDQWVDKNLRALRGAARLAAIQSMDRLQQEPILKALHDEYPYMYLVFTVQPNGMNLARNDGNPLTDYSDRQYYKDIMAGKALAWQTLIGRTSKKPALVLAVPIRAGDKTVGVMAAAMNIDDISQTVARWKKGQTGFAFLVDETGKVVAHQIEEYVVSEKKLDTHPLVAALRKEKKPATLSFTGESGQSALGHALSNSMGWVLAIQQDSAEVFAKLKRMEVFAATLLGITVVIVLIIAWLAARALVRPIQALTQVAEQMSMGDLNIQIPVTSKDEIGMLAQAIGRMQTSLNMAMSRLRRKR